MGQDFGYKKVDHNQVLVNRGDLQIILVTMAGLEKLSEDEAMIFNTAIQELGLLKTVAIAGLNFLTDIVEMGDEASLDSQTEMAKRVLNAAFN